MSDPNAPTLFRLRAAYVKHGRLAYLGHLEVLHTIERIVRRAELPYAVTQGFSPHMRVGFTSALPVGTASDAEYFDVFLTGYVPPREALERLRAGAPADLAPYAACYLDVRAPALTAAITRAIYRIRLDFAHGFSPAPAELSAALDGIVAAGEIPYARGSKRKVLDVAATLAGYTVEAAPAGEGDAAFLTLDTRMSNDGSLRPEILLAALDRALTPQAEHGGPIVSTGIQDLTAISRYSVCRTAQYVEDADGSLLSPLRTDETPSAPISVSSVPSL